MPSGLRPSFLVQVAFGSRRPIHDDVKASFELHMERAIVKVKRAEANVITEHERVRVFVIAVDFSDVMALRFGVGCRSRSCELLWLLERASMACPPMCPDLHSARYQVWISPSRTSS